MDTNQDLHLNGFYFQYGFWRCQTVCPESTDLGKTHYLNTTIIKNGVV